MLQQFTLHLDGRDVLAGAADDVLLAVDQPQRAIGGPHDDVAGMEPATVPGARGRRFVLEIFAEEAVARVWPGMTHQQFARRLVRRLAAVFEHKPEFDVVAGAAKTVGAATPWLVVGNDDRARAGLRHGPGLDQRKAEPFLES